MFPLRLSAFLCLLDCSCFVLLWTNGLKSMVHMWLLANKLTLNAKKTEFMLIGSRQRLSQIISDPTLSIGSEAIKRVSSTKTLGVMVDECITWNDHIDKVAKKAAKGIGILRRFS